MILVENQLLHWSHFERAIAKRLPQRQATLDNCRSRVFKTRQQLRTMFNTVKELRLYYYECTDHAGLMEHL